MSELDPIPTPPVREWWHSVYGPMDPDAARYLAITWKRSQHAETCPFSGGGTPYDCDCWRRAQAICAAELLRDAQRTGRWGNEVAEGINRLGKPPAGRTGANG
jgi:hypothetical protein